MLGLALKKKNFLGSNGGTTWSELSKLVAKLDIDLLVLETLSIAEVLERMSAIVGDFNNSVRKENVVLDTWTTPPTHSTICWSV